MWNFNWQIKKRFYAGKEKAVGRKIWYVELTLAVRNQMHTPDTRSFEPEVHYNRREILRLKRRSR